MKKKRRKIILKISVFAAISAVIVSFAVTAFFIPVQYLGAYINFSFDKSEEDSLRIRFMDVGFGDCTLIELPGGETMLIDGGVGTYSQTHKLLKTLNKSKIDTIDYLVCTSIKAEHCGGLREIVKYKTVKNAYIPYVLNKDLTDEFSAFYKELYKSGANISVAEYGKGEISKEGYEFCFLSPGVHTLGDSEYGVMNAAPTKENIDNASAVLWLQYKGVGFAFLGDAGKEAQNKIASALLLEQNCAWVGGDKISLAPCGLLKVASHCADGAAEETLLDVLSPRAAVISVGENAEAAPSVYEFARLLNYTEEIYRTDLNGCVTAVVKNGFSISKEKA